MSNDQTKSETQEEKKVKPKRKHVIDAMRFIEATSPENPCRFEQLGLDLTIYQSRIKHLIKNSVIRPVPTKEEEDKESELFYLDYDYYLDFKTQEDKRFFITIISIVIPGILLLLLGIIWLIL